MDREILDKQAQERDVDKESTDKKRKQEAEEERERQARESAVAAAAHFERVAHAVAAICDERSGKMPSLELDQFSDAERAALEQMYEAKAAPANSAIQLSAIVRMKMFNKALAVLYPTLSMGRLPQLNFEVEEYEATAEKVAELRAEIKDDINVEAIGFRKRAKKKEEEEDEGDEDDDEDDDDEDDGDGDGDGDGDEGKQTPAKQKKQSRLGRLFRRGKDKPEE